MKRGTIRGEHLKKKKPVVQSKERVTVYWDKKYVHMAYELALLGHKDHEIARVIGVAPKLFHRWQDQHSDLAIALQDGRDIADAKVATALFKRATGYSHPDVHISSFQGEITTTAITKYYPPDTAAATAWLRNRQKEKWAAEQGTAANLHLHANINLQNISTDDLEKAEKEGMKKLIAKTGETPNMN